VPGEDVGGDLVEFSCGLAGPGMVGDRPQCFGHDGACRGHGVYLGF
jgi:hypothetical protein